MQIFKFKKNKEIFGLIKKEEKRQQETLDLIASENYPSRAVREALSSIFVAKYSEGRPLKRYYAGMENVDKLETLVEGKVKEVFLSPKDRNDFSVNVQPLSGSPANYAVLRALLNKGDKILSLALPQGGHLSHGSPVSLAGMDFKIVNYYLDEKTGFLDYKEIEKIALREKPKMIICGFSAYPRKIDFKEFRRISDKVKAFLVADIAHVAGLVAGKAFPNPLPLADVVTTTTHKTLRGPRGALIICRKELEGKIFPKVFPGLQGGPHNHTICAIGQALKEASSLQFREYAKQIVLNAKALARELQKYGFILVSGGTDSHLILADLTCKGIDGREAQEILEKSGIVANKNAIPYDPLPPSRPSGIRFGTAALTTRGMKEKEMEMIAFWINQVIERKKPSLKIKKEIKKLCKKFPIP
jgi:glycine hydroxymethyltransferase